MTERAYNCPVQGCDFTTGPVEAVVAAALLNSHNFSHQTQFGSGSSIKAPPVERPKLQSLCPKGRGQKKKKMEISIFGFGPPPSKDGKVEQKKTSFRVLMAFSPIIGIKDGK